MYNQLDILFESTQLIAIHKPAGLIVEKNPWEDSVEDLVWEYINGKARKPYLGVIHRLDRVTSGVLLFAKKKSALKNLNAQFRERTVRKTYLAKVNTKPKNPSGQLIHFLEKRQKEKIAIIYESANTASQRVELTYNSLEPYLLSIQPKTGKFHQIRAQLAHIGSPIVGDEKYGSQTAFYKNQICLHAESLSFEAPNSQERITINAPIPKNWSV